jgi:hypothetical protein
MWKNYCTCFKPNDSIWGISAQVFQKSTNHFILQELTSHRKSMQTKIPCKVKRTVFPKFQYCFREVRDLYNK